MTIALGVLLLFGVVVLVLHEIKSGKLKAIETEVLIAEKNFLSKENKDAAVVLTLAKSLVARIKAIL